MPAPPYIQADGPLWAARQVPRLVPWLARYHPVRVSEQEQLQLAQQLHEGQMKYAYFLLAAAASAIALVVNQTQHQTLRWSMLPLGVAVVFWCLSFYRGCRMVEAYIRLTYSHQTVLAMEDGEHPLTGQSPARVAVGAKLARQHVDTASQAAATNAVWQFLWLIVGAVSYVAWHVLEMALRTFWPPC